MNCRLIAHIIIFFLLTVKQGQGQVLTRYNAFSYSVNEGLLQSTIRDMAVDGNNFAWISFPNGIQKFDGRNFINIPVQPGLPDDKVVNFFRLAGGDLLISHSYGISKYNVGTNRFSLVYSFPDAAKLPALFIGEDNGAIYLYTQSSEIIGLDGHSFKQRSAKSTGLSAFILKDLLYPKLSDNIINHKIAISFNGMVCLWDLQQEKFTVQVPVSPFLSYFVLRLKSDHEVIYADYRINNALQLYDFNIKKLSQLPVRGKNNEMISRCIIYPWNNKTLISFNNKIYETDSTLQVLRSELVNYQNEPVTGMASLFNIKEDNFGNLWLLTVTGGIRKLIRNNYPIKYYGTEEKTNNNVMALYADKENNRVLAGTSGKGLLVFDTLQQLIRHIQTLPGKEGSFSVNNIIKTTRGDYLLFIPGEKNTWRLNAGLSQLSILPMVTSVPEEQKGIAYFGNPLYQNEYGAVSQSQSRLYKTNFKTGVVQEHEFARSYIMSGIFHNNMIITHGGDELIYLDAATFKELKRIPFNNTGNVRCFTKDAGGNIYMGTNKGIFKTDSNGNILQHLEKQNGLPDECIYALAFDNEGNLWCSANKGIFKINKDNSITRLAKNDGLQENEFNTNAVFKTADGELFFGGVNGISSFYPSAINNFDEQVKLLVTQIRVNNEDVFKDTAVWNIGKLRLPYYQNSLSFDFIAMANNNPGQYVYQYKMEGIDKEWIQNNDLQTIRYFLPPGKYVLKLYAGRSFDKDARPMKEISIIITPPFWKTAWFLSGIILLGMGLLAFSINRYNKNKYRKKLQALESEHKIKLERERISKDLHDSLGAYANAILYNTELLQEEQNSDKREQLMTDLKFASKDIITSLRETIWALNKEHYTAEECLVRIRNFIQPLNRYYEQVKLWVEGDAPPGFSLNYKQALHLVRIVQEAVTNCIKHAHAKNIMVSSLLLNGRWIVKVSDDGQGFDATRAREEKTGNGLGNMEQRAADGGFTLEIESRADSGSLISVTI